MMPVTKVEDFQSFQSEVECAEKVLVKFEADWCLPCRAMASVIEEIANKHPDLKVVAVDVDGEGMEPVLKKYGVRAVPTFVHVRRGTTIRSTSGTVSKAELSSLVEDV
jgi:thioredoxin 1